MVSQETVSHILEEAVQTPSGDNSQPWRFVWSEKDQALFLYNLPDNDNPIFNYEQRGSLIAHGALLENIRLLAGKYQLQASIQTLPDTANTNFIARITFAPGSFVDPLVNAIEKRHTNRKAYSSRALTETELETLLKNGGEGIALTAEQSDSGKTQLAHAVSVAEQIMLQFKPLHDYFFHMIRWTGTQDKKHQSGLYVKTMELLPPQVVIFKLYSFWSIAKILNAFGLSKFIGNENAKIYKQASAFILFSTPDNTPESYLRLGSVLQRVWLTATELGLSVQPVAGVLYLNQRLAADQLPELLPAQQKLIADAAQNIASTFAIPIEHARMLIRVGEASPPTAYARKKIPTIDIV